MHPIALAILVLYLLLQAADNLLTMLNLRHLARHGDTVPAGFEDHISRDTLRKMTDYTLAHSRIDLLSAGVDIAVTIAFFFGGGLNWYNGWINSLGLPFVWGGVLFFLLLIYAETLLKIPFSLYMTFSVEKRFAFNNQTPALWISDTLKAVLLSTVISGAMLAGALWIIHAFPGYWWIVVWTFFLTISLFLLYIAPYIIEPLFNKFTPIEDTALEKRITSLMLRAGLSVSRVFKMDASRRSKHSNAYFSGIGRVKRIILFDTLLATNSHDEIIAVLAHETGHWKKKHLIKRLLIMETAAFIIFYAVFKAAASPKTAMLPFWPFSQRSAIDLTNSGRWVPA
jgi:STE24 endopeptidase